MTGLFRNRAGSRMLWLDAVRGIALVAMAVYHTAWDLEFFGYLDAGTANSGAWKLFARSIASSFIFLAGLGIVLGHAGGFRRDAFVRRIAQIVAAALVISVATWFIFPGAFIYFGILHHIAFASLAGAALLRVPSLGLAALAIAVIVLDRTVQIAAFDTRWLAWTGLYQAAPASNDFVPVVPWFAAALLGMLAGRWLVKRPGAANWQIAPRPVERALGFFGRHSLATYLVHQPVILAVLYGVTLIAPPPPRTVSLPAFQTACESQCSTNPANGEQFCEAWCRCTAEAFDTQGLLALDAQAMRESPAFQTILNECTIQTETPQ